MAIRFAQYLDDIKSKNLVLVIARIPPQAGDEAIPFSKSRLLRSLRGLAMTYNYLAGDIRECRLHWVALTMSIFYEQEMDPKAGQDKPLSII